MGNPPPGLDGALPPDGSSPDGGGGGGTKPGDPCPCASPLLCVLGACRAPCTASPCNEGGPCGANEACIPTDANQSVCVPAAKEGQACDPNTVCAIGLLCLEIGPSTHCWKSCTIDPTCAGTCWDIPGSACRYCGP